MIKIVIAALIALIIGVGGGYQAARMKYKDILQSKDSQIGILEQTVDNARNEMEQIAASKEKEELMNKGFMMKNGKMVIDENGKTTSMTSAATLDDGSIVSTLGVVTKKDGTKMTLKEGESIWMDGSVMMDKDEEVTEKTVTPEPTAAEAQ